MPAPGSEGSRAAYTHTTHTPTHARTRPHRHTHTQGDSNSKLSWDTYTCNNIIISNHSRHYTDRKALYTSAYHTVTVCIQTYLLSLGNYLLMCECLCQHRTIHPQQLEKHNNINTHTHTTSKTSDKSTSSRKQTGVTPVCSQRGFSAACLLCLWLVGPAKNRGENELRDRDDLFYCLLIHIWSREIKRGNNLSAPVEAQTMKHNR